MSNDTDYRATVFLPRTDFPMKAGLPQKEPTILARWLGEGLYEKLRDARRGREKFILHDGPPYANGDMHIGHALNHILKDMVCRTQSLLGKDAPYVPGWDCHGLPIEWKVEEKYRAKKLNKDEVPAKEFRAECRAYAQGWVDTQREQLKRLGINGDWDHPYLTMDFQAEATIVSELLKFADSGQLYRGAKPVMWSPVEKTALAEAEVEYEDITSTQIDVAFEIVSSPISELVGAHAVIWTTTPWTIPVNQALAYGPDIEYVSFSPVVLLLSGMDNEALTTGLSTTGSLGVFGRTYVIAKSRLADFKSSLEQETERRFKTVGIDHEVQVGIDVSREFMGSDLAGTIARHPMHHLGGFFAKPRPLLAGDFVTTDAGTGLVHMAPDHGEDDFLLCKANGIEPVFAVEGDGKYRADWAWLGGQGSVINPKFNSPEGPICADLREAGALVAASADFRHSYPHSWRSKAKVIFRATPQWFIPMDVARPAPSTAFGGPPPPGGEDQASNPPPLGEGNPAQQGGGGTLRDTALAAIAATRFVPEKGRNRINAMVEGRPDWVISRQRAWGVPITLFVDRKTGQYLNDPEVNARIVATIREQGVDGWSDENARSLLGDGYAAADYERVADILDVWFDSGCTHAFVLESGRWPDLTWPADLYLEGSDQHRGWFQSSLLESCGTRGRAPYKAVLTHGFTMDAKGMKMSKSLGNTINPLDLMRDNGADILRLWALSVDFTEDHRIGKEILAGVADQYRKLRNTFRYLLGALDGFSEDERVAPEAMPELERYVLHLLAEMDGKLRQAVEDFDFNTYVRLLTDFANNDLSAFFFDIRKDSLYCDVGPALPGGTDKRRAYRTVLDTLFHALVRYAAPVLVFTAEEVWGTRFPEGGSVHLLEWPDFATLLDSNSCHPGESRDPAGEEEGSASATILPTLDPGFRRDDSFVGRWQELRRIRNVVSAAVEPLRRNKELGSSLEADVFAAIQDNDAAQTAAASADMAELCIISKFDLTNGRLQGGGGFALPDVVGLGLHVKVSNDHKCGRCWRHLPEVVEDGNLCDRCEEMVHV